VLVTRQKVLHRFWYATVRLDALKDGPQPFTLLGQKIVLFLDEGGRPAALKDRCCHRTAMLSRGFCEGGRIVCGYHGWTYDRTGALVRVPQQPAKAIPSGARVPAYHCEARYGYAWVALEAPLLSIPQFPEDDDRQYRRIFQFYETWQTSPLRLMENSFDNSHFSYVHKANFGQYEQPRPSKYEIHARDWGFEAETIVPINNPPASHRITGTTAPTTERHLFNRWFMPFVRRFGCHYPSGLKHIIYNCATPIDDKSIQVVQWLYRNDREEDCSTDELIAWDRAIVDEDRSILEATDYDACVDTRRRVEFHMESDQPGLMMRKMLMQLLKEHGEAEVHR
jgi:phenylpropionate dioxygenase-like ring-hydroxylating dioxygenase large terminal subunit